MFAIDMMIDDTNLPELTHRQEEILSCIVRAYSDTPEPLSSKFLVERFNLTYSSATVRNEMAALEELGYISAPHTSAGRVPTENGYRYFVTRLIVQSDSDLTTLEHTHISERLSSLPLGSEHWMILAATILARTAQTAALVTPPISDSSRFKHIQLIALQGRLVLMVLVLQGGAVHQQMLTLAEPLTQDRLSETANRLNATLLDVSAYEMRVRAVNLPLLEREIVELATEAMGRADQQQVRLIYRSGLSETISAFAHAEGAQQAIRVLEERAFLNMILTELLTPLINHVQVVIAGDGRWEELSHLSMVLSRYGVPGQLSGAIGVLGPTHLNYGRAISAVNAISTAMTDMLASVYENDTLPPTSETD